jgi:hypothetical protein
MATRNLKMEESTARSMYKTATAEVKSWLEENFSKEFFSVKITDRIKTFEDVMKEALLWFTAVQNNQVNAKTKIQKMIYDILLNHVRGGRVTADDRVRLLIFVLNEGWEPNFRNSNESKYYLWFERKASGWAVGVGVCGYDFSFVGAGFHFRSRELALYGGNNFLPLFVDYLPE